MSETRTRAVIKPKQRAKSGEKAKATEVALGPAQGGKTDTASTSPAPEIPGAPTVRFSNQTKVLYPATGFTKGELIAYYQQVAPVLLPHLAGRPLTLKRYPDGVDGKFFYEKRCPVHRPDWVEVANIHSERNGGDIGYCVAADLPTLEWLGNLACIELHPLLAKADHPDRPTSMVFDFDPGEPANLLDCAKIALRARDVLHRLGLESFPKTSGGKGLHFWVPLNTAVTFDQTKRFAHAVAIHLEKEDPAAVTSQMKKDLRHGRVFIDWSQNDSHKTTCSAYSPRAKERPSISSPLAWLELERAIKRDDPSSLSFGPDDVIKRVKSKGDLFEPVLKLKQKLPAFAE